MGLSSAQIDQLCAQQSVAVGGYVLSLTLRGTNRLVLSYYQDDANTDWLEVLCKQSGFSQLNIAQSTKAAPDTDALRAALVDLVKSPHLEGIEAVSLCAMGPACGALLETGHLFTNPVVFMADPPADLRPAPEALSNQAQAVYLLYDPFFEPNTVLIQSLDDAILLKLFGVGQDTVWALGRMHMLPMVGAGVIRDDLVPDLFYERARVRHNYPFYRVAMEAALEARGKGHLVKSFRQAFRRRLNAANPDAQFEKMVETAEAARPGMAGDWVRAGGAGDTLSWPSAGGNVWMLEQTPGRLRYMSDRWQKRTIGFEERGGITLAQTPALALGFLSFGGDTHVPRPLPRNYRWHVTDETLDGNAALLGPVAEASLFLEDRDQRSEVLHSVIAIAQCQPGSLPADTAPEAKPYQALLAKVEKAVAALARWDKTLHIDRVRLGLMRGTQSLPQAEAAAHLSETAMRLSRDLCQRTGQAAAPLMICIQSAGTRENGRNEAILAEGRFDQDNPGLNALVVSPAYPWPLMEGTPGTPAPASAMIMDELSALAVSAHHKGQRWYCPSLQLARLKGAEIIAEFATMDGLVLRGRAHGFRLSGSQEQPAITKVDVISDRTVRLTLAAEPAAGDLTLSYAWGAGAQEARPGYAANAGSLSDRWQAPSTTVADQVLRRYALSGSVPVLRHG